MHANLDIAADRSMQSRESRDHVQAPRTVPPDVERKILDTVAALRSFRPDGKGTPRRPFVPSGRFFRRPRRIMADGDRDGARTALQDCLQGLRRLQGRS